MSQCHCPDCSDTPSPTYTEEHRAACEARYVAALPTLHQRRAFLAGVRERRGAAGARDLERAVAEVWDAATLARQGRR